MTSQIIDCRLNKGLHNIDNALFYNPILSSSYYISPFSSLGTNSSLIVCLVDASWMPSTKYKYANTLIDDHSSSSVYRNHLPPHKSVLSLPRLLHDQQMIENQRERESDRRTFDWGTNPWLLWIKDTLFTHDHDSINIYRIHPITVPRIRVGIRVLEIGRHLGISNHACNAICNYRNENIFFQMISLIALTSQFLIHLRHHIKLSGSHFPEEVSCSLCTDQLSDHSQFLL